MIGCAVGVAAAEELRLEGEQGMVLPAALTLQAGESVQFRARGGSGSYVGFAEPNAAGEFGELERLADGWFRYTAPDAGAFAGTHRAGVTDAAQGARVALRIEVPLHASLAPLEALGGVDTLALTVRGAVAGEALMLAAVDAQATPSEALVPAPLTAVEDAARGNPARLTLPAQDVAQDAAVRVVVESVHARGHTPYAQVWAAQAFAGTVHGEDGAPLEGVEVRLAGLTVNGKGYAVRTDPSGRFQLAAPRQGLIGLLAFGLVDHAPGELAAEACASDASFTPVCAVSLAPLDGTHTAAPRLEEAEQPLVQGDTLSIATDTAGATIHYTLDGSEPSRGHGEVIEQAGEIAIEDDATLKAFAFQDGLADSTVTSAELEVSRGRVKAPEMDPDSGTFEREVKVRLTTDTKHATIKYTLDGSTPSRRNGKRLKSGKQITLKQSTLLRAMAYRDKGNWEESAVVAGHYLIIPRRGDAPEEPPPPQKPDDEPRDEDDGGEGDAGNADDRTAPRDEAADKNSNDEGTQESGAQTQSGSSRLASSGGGCALGAGAPDPLLPMLGALAWFSLRRRYNRLRR